MNIVIQCEFSGIVREAFRRRGHNAVSCDLEPTEVPGPHLQCDARDVLYMGWDMMIAFPPCTYLCSQGNAVQTGNKDVRLIGREEAIDFVKLLADADISKIAIENPIGVLSTRFRRPDQYIQPYEYGHRVTKKTCLWLKNLPLLQPTNIISADPEDGAMFMNGSGIHGKFRQQWRSRTFTGIAEAMAAQWG